MKIKLLANICGPEGSYTIGKEVELSEKLATALIKDGHAKEIKPVIEDETVIKTVIEDETVIKKEPKKNKKMR